MTTEDKQRMMSELQREFDSIPEVAVMYEDGLMVPSEGAIIVSHFYRKIIDERTIANKQLEEKGKELEEVIKHNNLLTQNGGLLNELKDKDLQLEEKDKEIEDLKVSKTSLQHLAFRNLKEIEALKQALRKAAIQLKCDKGLIMLWVEPEAPREYEIKSIDKLVNEIEQLLK